MSVIPSRTEAGNSAPPPSLDDLDDLRNPIPVALLRPIVFRRSRRGYRFDHEMAELCHLSDEGWRRLIRAGHAPEREQHAGGPTPEGTFGDAVVARWIRDMGLEALSTIAALQYRHGCRGLRSPQLKMFISHRDLKEVIRRDEKRRVRVSS